MLEISTDMIEISTVFDLPGLGERDRRFLRGEGDRDISFIFVLSFFFFFFFSSRSFNKRDETKIFKFKLYDGRHFLSKDRHYLLNGRHFLLNDRRFLLNGRRFLLNDRNLKK